MASVSSWLLLVSGLALLGNALNAVPLIGDALAKVGRWLAGFGVFIGVLDILAFFGIL